MKEAIPLDINNVKIPEEVIMSDIASSIVSSCNHFGIYKKKDIPTGLKRFVNKYFHEGIGSDWFIALLKATEQMSDELLKRWFGAMPPGYFRANMRGVMYERKLLSNPNGLCDGAGI
jgi:hypothetical protein